MFLVASVDIVIETSTSEELTPTEAFGDVYFCNGSCNREKYQLLDGHVTTLRSIYVCGAWSLVHKLTFTIKQHVRTTEPYKTHFSCQKRSTCYLGNKCLKIFQFNQPIIAGNNSTVSMWTTYFRRFLDISTNKASSFYNCQECRASYHMLDIPSIE